MIFFCIILSVISSSLTGCGMGACGRGWEHVAGVGGSGFGYVTMTYN